MIDNKDNYLINAELSTEDNYNCVDGIINNTTPLDEDLEKNRKYFEKIKKEEETKKFPLSSNVIKSNASIISNSSSRLLQKPIEQDKSLL